jgi:serine/threonine protein kinase
MTFWITLNLNDNFIFIESFWIFKFIPAPEIIEEGQAFPQSDIWSLGVLLYVLLAGQLPFKGETAEETK